MGKIALLLLIALAAALAMTNPNQETHKQALYGNLAADRGANSAVSRLAGEMLGDMDPLAYEYHNYGVFSTVTRKNEVVSVGALSHVWQRR